MNFFALMLVFLVGCTQKYADYDLIRKVDFQKESYERPIPATQVLPDGRDQLQQCFHQWLFFSNAEKVKDQEIPQMVRMLCPGKEYLLNATFTERWWTTIIYSQACIDIETLCGMTRKNK